MNRRLFLRAASAAFSVGVISWHVAPSWGARPSKRDEESTATPIELFDAISAGQLSVTVIPRDEKQVRLHLENKTEKPLSIQFPAALAGLPVLAQFGPFAGGLNAPFGGNGNGNNRGGNPLQALGIGGPFGQANGQGGPQGNPFGNPFGNGFMNVPVGKVSKLTLPAVCLNYGKTEPTPRNPYSLHPLASHNASPVLREIIESLAKGNVAQDIAQLAAWHIANDMSWESMRHMTVRRPYGKVEPVFSSSALAKAKKFVEQLPASKTGTQQSSSATSLAN